MIDGPGVAAVELVEAAADGHVADEVVHGLLVLLLGHRALELEHVLPNVAHHFITFTLQSTLPHPNRTKSGVRIDMLATQNTGD